MAKLTQTQRAAVRQQLRTRVVLEQKLEKELRRVFRGYVQTIAQFVNDSGLFYFPNQLKEEIASLLLKHYNRAARQSFSFTRTTRKKSWGSLQIDRKLWETKSSAVPKVFADTIDTRMKIRLQEIFNQVVALRSESIALTSEIEIRKYIEKVGKKAQEEGIFIDRQTFAKIIKEFYFKRIDHRSKSISITETTYPMEVTKRVEVEEVLDELSEEELLDLAAEGDPESMEELRAILGDMTDSGELSDEAIASVGGFLTLSASLGLTKTWVAVMDEVTREGHAEADGQTVGIEEMFDIDGEELDFPGDDAGSPENVINCRCSTVYGAGDED